MNRPSMLVVAGPAGAGKSGHLPVHGFGYDGFNVDFHAAQENNKSFVNIPRGVRLRAQRACEAFILDHIARGESFAVETTLRSGIAIQQARQASGAGFATVMMFIAAGSADEHVRRVRLRGLGGGHAAPEAEIRDIYARSLANLVIAMDVFERIELYDNSAWRAKPQLVARVIGRKLSPKIDPLPDWIPPQLR